MNILSNIKEKEKQFDLMPESTLLEYKLYAGNGQSNIANKQLPNELFVIYQQITRLNISWEYSKYSKKKLVYINILRGIESDWSILKNKSFRHISKFCEKNNLHGFTDSDNNYGVLAQYKDKNDSVKLYLYLPSGNIYPLNVSVEKYAELFIKTGAIDYWELYITEEYPEELKDRDYDGFFENMELLFPEEDLSDFKHRELFKGKKDLLREMGGNSYRHQFDKAFENLPNSIKIYKHYIGDYAERPTSLSIFRKIELELNIHLPKAFKQLYMCLGGFVMRWLCNDSNLREASGISRFVHVWQVFNAEDLKQSTFCAYLDLKEQQFPKLEGLHMVYLQEREMLGFKLINGEMKFYVVIYDGSIANYHVHLLDMDFDSILQAFLECRGLNHWLALLVGDDSYRDIFMENLAALFPDADSSIFEE